MASKNEKLREYLKRNFRYTKFLSEQLLEKRNCPLCSSKQFVNFASNGDLNYVKCSDCQLIYMNPVYTSTPEDPQTGVSDKSLMRDYFQLVYEADSSATERAMKAPVDPLSDSKLKDIYPLSSGGKLLDVGCSWGEFLAKADPFFQVEGLEPNPHTAALAAKNHKVHPCFLKDLINEGETFRNRYDVVTLHQILFGLRNPLELCQEIHQVLKPGGFLYINTPNGDSLAVEIFGGKVNHLYGYTSLNLFNRRALQKLAELSGFEIIQFRTEFLDVHALDLLELYEHPEEFIHKKNTHLPGYENLLKKENEIHRDLPLGDRGNYLVAILRKIEL